MTQLLTDRVAIITGGTSGIGLASVERFVAEGARVMIADIQDDAGEALVGRLGDRVAYTHTDVSREAMIEALVAATVHRFGKLDIMFNNAGAAGVSRSSPRRHTPHCSAPLRCRHRTEHHSVLRLRLAGHSSSARFGRR